MTDLDKYLCYFRMLFSRRGIRIFSIEEDEFLKLWEEVMQEKEDKDKRIEVSGNLWKMNTIN